MATPIEIRNDDDIKILILYLLDNIDTPLDFDTICEIIFTTDFVRHFDFTEQFLDLLDRNIIKEITVNNEAKKRYVVTAYGKTVLAEFEGKLLGIIKDKALLAAKRFIEKKKRGFEIYCYIEPSPLEDDPDGAMLYCGIKDNRLSMLKMETYVGSMRIAEDMKIIFEKRAEEILNQFHAILSENLNLL